MQFLPRRHRKPGQRTVEAAREAARLVRSAAVAKAYIAALPPDNSGPRRAGLKASDYRILERAMERVAKMSDDQRVKYGSVVPRRQPPPLARKALQLRIAGMPYWEIAEVLEAEELDVQQAVARQLRALQGEEIRNADLARQLHLERLDAMMQALFPKALDGNADAATVVLRCLDRQSKLLGLDAPQKVDITHRLKLMAEQEGLDYEELLAEAQAVIKALPPR